jgi:hypothetical protein
MKILRWIVLIPASVLGASCLALIFEWFFKLSISNSFMCDPEGIYVQLIALFSSNVVNGIAIVFIAFYIAPSHQTKASLVCAVINVISAFIMILFNFYNHLPYMFANLFFYCINALASIIAVVWIYNNLNFSRYQ